MWTRNTVDGDMKLYLRLQTIKKMDGREGHDDDNVTDWRSWYWPGRLGCHSTSSPLVSYLDSPIKLCGDRQRERERERVLMLVMEGRMMWWCDTTYLRVGGGRSVDHLEAGCGGGGGGGGTVTIPSVSTALPTRQLLSEELQWGCNTPILPESFILHISYIIYMYNNYIRSTLYGVWCIWFHGVFGAIVSWCHSVTVSQCHGVMVSWCHSVMVSFEIKFGFPAWQDDVLLGDRTAEQWKLLFFKFSNFCKVFCRA